MINLLTNKQFNIILPNTNKALAHVMENASPKELESITQGKDLSSVLESLFKKASSDVTQDKTLLTLVKNNPTLKSLGSVTNSINNLITNLKSDKTSLPIEDKLKNFLVNIKDLSEPVLKQKIENSGVFLESKLKSVQNPQVNLRKTLTSLTKTLDKSQIFNVTVLSENLKEILQTDVIKNASNKSLLQLPADEKQALNDIVKTLKTVLPKLQEHIKGADIINTKEFANTLSKLEHLIEPKMLKSENFKPTLLQETLTQISSQLSQSTNSQTKSIVDALGKIFTLLKSTPSAENLVDKNISQDLKATIENLKSIISKTDTIYSKEVSSHLQKLTQLSSSTQLTSNHNVKEIKNSDLKAILNQATAEIQKSDYPNKPELLKSIGKLAMQIDYNQLVSHLSNATSLYIPFSWNQMQEGQINIQKDKEDERFTVDIDLKLKEYGELNLKLSLYDKNQLNIHIYSSNSELKELVKENLPSLRSALIKNQITPREMRIFDKAKKQPVESPYESAQRDINIGFEVKA